jgi:hypothetical protein
MTSLVWELGEPPDHELGRPVAIKLLSLPSHVRLRGAHVESDYRFLIHEPNLGIQQKVPHARMLRRFLDLHQGRSREILNFVQDYGPLCLCRKHGLPVHHPVEGARPLNSPCSIEVGLRPETAQSDDIELIQKYGFFDRYSEPIVAYRKLADWAYRLLFCAAALRRGERVESGDWPWDRQKVLSPISTLEEPKLMESLTFTLDPRVHVAVHVRWWFYIAGLGLGVSYDSGHSRGGMRLEPFCRETNPLFGVLAMQLLAAVRGDHGTALCDECGRLFTARRKQAVGRAQRCEDCGVHAAWRRASQRYRKRKGHKRQRRRKQ